ncbi:MAG: hypothetical protein IT385_11185, partial [Deltaproteobacteria bacterium]|nr:hypothetical protein [Deltaproteobacteria bacterium]
MSPWVNGNLNQNQAHYVEGDAVPYRLRFSDLTTGTTLHTVRIEWDTTVSGTHALDYITSYDATETTADPCAGVPGCVLTNASTYPIPLDPMVVVGPDGLLGTGDDIVQEPGVLTLFGGTIVTTSAYTVAGDYGGSSETSIVITFTADVSNPVLAWGGHVSVRFDWQPEPTAIDIPGSPFHTRLIDLDGGGGNQDRSLSAAAVYRPPELVVTKHVVNDEYGEAVASDFTMTVTGSSPEPASFPGDEAGTLVTLQPGAYSVGETGPTGYAATYTGDCTGTAAYDVVRHCTVTNDDMNKCIGVECPPPSGECLEQGVCDPTTGDCTYAFKPEGTPCGDPSDTVCDNPDTCDPSGQCLPNFEPATTLCRGDAGDCDVPEYCDAAGACPSNGFEPEGTLCGDGTETVCDKPDTCDPSGVCL